MKRNEVIDFSKGMLILGVTYGHIVTALLCGDPYFPALYSFVRTYDMPMFAFISGILLSRSVRKHLLYYNLFSKILLTIVPAILWEIIIYGLVVRSRPIPFGSIWYLYAIGIVLSIIILTRALLNRFPFFALCIAFVIETILFHTFLIDAFNVGFLLFPACVGYVFGEKNILGFSLYKNIDLKKNRAIILCLSCIFIGLEVFWKRDYNVWNTSCDILRSADVVRGIYATIYRGVIGIVGSIVMYILFQQLFLLFQRNQHISKIATAIAKIGIKTELLYILQCLFVSTIGSIAVNRIIKTLGYNPFMLNKFVLGYIIAPVITIIAIIFMYYVGLMCEKIPIIGPHIFGIKLSKLNRKRKA